MSRSTVQVTSSFLHPVLQALVEKRASIKDGRQRPLGFFGIEIYLKTTCIGCMG